MTNKRLAYYLWHYPILSETFIQREIAAVLAAGLPLVVIADRPGDMPADTAPAQSEVNAVVYLFPLSIQKLLRYLIFYLIRKPGKLFQAAHAVFTKRYQQHQNVIENLRILVKSIYLAGDLRMRKIDHVHGPWSDVNAFILFLAARIAGIPYSLQARAHDIHRLTACYACDEKFGQAAFVVTNSCFNKTHINTLLTAGIRPTIHVIYEGMPLNLFHPQPKRDNPLQTAQILAVGRLIEQKGFVYLLKACGMLREKGYHFHCTIIGGAEAPLYADHPPLLNQLQQELMLREHVTFTGAQQFDAVLKALGSADIFVLPCVKAADGSCDITPNALMEAMAMKLPVISTRFKAIPEIIDDRISGLLVPPQDEQALALAISRLIDDDALRLRLGENARRRIEDKFDIAKNIQQFIALFEY